MGRRRYLTIKQKQELSELLGRLYDEYDDITEQGMRSWGIDKQAALVDICRAEGHVDRWLEHNS